MKKPILFLTLAAALGLVGCEKVKYQTKIEKVIEHVAPEVDWEKYPDAKRRLAEHIEACGEGVVENAPAPDCEPGKPCPVPENRCTYQITVDEWFLMPDVARTGYTEDLKALRSTGQFMAPTAQDLAAVPDEWSLLDIGKARDVKINRQQCGDCWAQATTKALEYMIAAHDKKIVNLSVQTHISRCSNHGSCGGGFMTAPDFLVRFGNPFESQDPYQGRNSSCKFTQSEIEAGFEYKVKSAPYVGSSLNYSRFHRSAFRAPSAASIRAMMFKNESPAVMTIAAISQSGGIIKRCSAINSGGNHMQSGVGWYKDEGEFIAVVNNSWGVSHGQDGFTHIQWECGEGKLNRGLGRSARVYIYEPKCQNQPNAETGPDVQFVKSSPQHGVIIGHKPENVQTCTWAPSMGLTYLTEDHCQAFASPDVSTEYHLTAKTECGEATSMVLVQPLGPMRESLSWGPKGERVVTPLGEVVLSKEEL